MPISNVNYLAFVHKVRESPIRPIKLLCCVFHSISLVPTVTRNYGSLFSLFSSFVFGGRPG